MQAVPNGSVWPFGLARHTRRQMAMAVSGPHAHRNTTSEKSVIS